MSLNGWGLGVFVSALLKITWSVAIVIWLASSEPFWHQAILVLGGAIITSASVVIAAMISTRDSRRNREAVHEVKDELIEHRQIIENGGAHE